MTTIYQVVTLGGIVKPLCSQKMPKRLLKHKNRCVA